MPVTQSYVYQVTHPETGEFYIGSRTIGYGSVDRDYYVGSGRWPTTVRKSGVKLGKEIIQVFEYKSDARNLERSLIQKNSGNGLCKNIQAIRKYFIRRDGPNERANMSTAKTFLKEIETFLKKTGMPASTFGREALGDSKLVYTLRNGRSPTADTMDLVRAFIIRFSKVTSNQ